MKREIRLQNDCLRVATMIAGITSLIPNWDGDWGDPEDWQDRQLAFIADKFPDMGTFFDGDPTMPDCRKMLVATMRAALAVLDPLPVADPAPEDVREMARYYGKDLTPDSPEATIQTIKP